MEKIAAILVFIIIPSCTSESYNQLRQALGVTQQICRSVEILSNNIPQPIVRRTNFE